MAKWLDDIRYSFNKGDNMVRKLIFINIAVFLLINVNRVFAYFIYGSPAAADTINHWIFLPADLTRFVYQPWSLFTYMFVHQGIFHIFFNMLWLYFLGNLFQEYLGKRKLLMLYLYGGLSGGLMYMVFMNLMPVLRNSVFFPFPLHGASASVMAVIVGIATLLPNYRIRIIFFDVKLKYIAFFMVVTSFIGMQGNNPGGNLAHLGGILSGYFYIRHQKKYSFLDRWEEAVRRLFGTVFKKRRDEKKMYRTYTTHMKVEDTRRPDQGEVDAILDKISRSGYDSLTRNEREILFKASKDN